MRKLRFHFKFEDLTMYAAAMEFGEVVNSQTKKFSTKERFELTKKFKRVADSIALNIAEEQVV